MAWACHFCGGTSNPTREHVFPAWLLEELGLARKETRAIHQTLLGTQKDTRTMTHGSMVLGKVCADCNHGWMSQLEVDVRSVLRAARDRRLVHTVDGEVLATWAFKTAIVLNRWSNYRKLAPDTHFRWLKETGTPASGVVVDVGYLKAGWARGVEGASSDLSYRQSMIQVWALPSELQPNHAQLVSHFQEQSYVIVLTVEACAFRVAYCPIGGMRLEPTLAWGQTFRLWPVPQHGLMQLDTLRPFDSPAHFAMAIKATSQ